MTINARGEDDVEPETILEKVAKASGGNFSFHKHAQEFRDTPTGPVVQFLIYMWHKMVCIFWLLIETISLLKKVFIVIWPVEPVKQKKYLKWSSSLPKYSTVQYS